MSSFSNNTILAQDMTLIEAKRQYDMEAKNLLSYRCIIAYFLKYCTDEFAGYSLLEIDKCLGGDGKQLTGEGKIQLKNSKDNLPGLVSIEFDLLFDAKTPAEVKVQVDMEPQKGMLSEKVKKNRGCYYLARMVSGQSNTIFQRDNYQDMQAVYSIWIIFHAGSRTNTIEEYRMQNVKRADDAVEPLCQSTAGIPGKTCYPDFESRVLLRSGLSLLC